MSGQTRARKAKQGPQQDNQQDQPTAAPQGVGNQQALQNLAARANAPLPHQDRLGRAFGSGIGSVRAVLGQCSGAQTPSAFSTR